MVVDSIKVISQQVICIVHVAVINHPRSFVITYLTFSVTPFEKDRDDPLRNVSSALPPAKPSHHFRPNGIKNNIRVGERLPSPKTNGAASSK